jgi:hypothetical protein
LALQFGQLRIKWGALGVELANATFDRGDAFDGFQIIHRDGLFCVSPRQTIARRLMARRG